MLPLKRELFFVAVATVGKREKLLKDVSKKAKSALEEVKY